MSNRTRRQRAGKNAPRPHISCAEKVRTLRLYLEYESSNRVGEELGISGPAVRDRLWAIGAVLLPQGYKDDGFERRMWRIQNEALLRRLEES